MPSEVSMTVVDGDGRMSCLPLHLMNCECEKTSWWWSVIYLDEKKRENLEKEGRFCLFELGPSGA